MVASVVDLFCGAGGLTRGFLEEGFDVRGGFDLDPACRFPYEHNNGVRFFERDVTDLEAGEVSDLFGGSTVRIISGCAPCQKFSTYTRRREDVRPERWGLLRSFAQIVESIRPEIVTMENVVELKKHPVFRDFVASLENLGYFVTRHETDCRKYGVPQSRKRLVVFAALDGPVELTLPTHAPGAFVTVRQTIEEMEPIAAGGVAAEDPMHRSSSLSELNLRRIRCSVQGGTWRDWDESLRTDCHAKPTGKTYPSVYGRMSWDYPAPTITTQAYGYGNGRFGHPVQDRGLSLREMALLQAFPRDYEFVEPGGAIHMKTVGRLIGNAVPVSLGRTIARSIRAHVEGADGG